MHKTPANAQPRTFAATLRHDVIRAYINEHKKEYAEFLAQPAQKDKPARQRRRNRKREDARATYNFKEDLRNISPQ